MKSVKITHFFDVIKKEVTCETEVITPVAYDHTEVKQEYHYKEELDVPWDERDNVSENKENLNASNNTSRKLDYPIVLVERLSYDAVNNSLSAHHRDNTFKTLSVLASNKRNFLQYYRKICPECHKIGSSVKPTDRCQHRNKEWNYECNKCKKQYSSYSSITNHLESKCLEKGYYFACFKCNYKSASKFKVNGHLKNVHSMFNSLNRIEKFESDNVQKDTATKLHKCTKCGEGFKKLPPFLRHMQVCGQAEGHTRSNNFDAIPNVVKGKCVHYCMKCNKTVKDDNVGPFHLKKCQTCDSKFSFKCKECNQVFHTYHGINDHLKYNHRDKHSSNEDVFKCHQCDYKSNFLKRLVSHVVKTHSEETHECHICGGKYKNREAFNTHLRNTHVQEAEFQCDTCSFRSKVKANLRRHIMEVHIGGKAIECPKCNITLKSKSCLKVHLSYCSKEPSHLCNKCSFKTKYKFGLKRHYETVHSSILTKNKQCPHCAKEIKNKHYLRNHLRFCKRVAAFSCNYCSNIFKSKNGLKDHVLRVHSKDDGVDKAVEILYFHCDNCTYKSRFKGDLVKHVSLHSDDHKQECPKCKKYFTKEYIKKHKEYCGKKGLQCGQCDYLASTKETLRKHMGNVHSEGNEIDCPKCGKTCKNKTYYRAHLKRCGTDPHLQCGYCSYKTKYKYVLKKHIEATHSKSKKPRLE